jgi:membrane protein implicated in regulation of membrane protease activity
VLAIGAMWGGLALGYAVPALPPSSAIVMLAVGAYAAAWALAAWARRRGRLARRLIEAPADAGADATTIGG